jgi:RHS repeat-associated protein
MYKVMKNNKTNLKSYVFWFAKKRALFLLFLGLLTMTIPALGVDNPPVAPDVNVTEEQINPGGEYFGDPINIVDGTMLLEETDMVINTPIIPLNFTRAWMSSYNGTIPDGGLGNGWVHSYQWTINEEDILGYTSYDFINGTFQGVQGSYAVLTALVNPVTGKYSGGRYFFVKENNFQTAKNLPGGTGVAISCFVGQGERMRGARLYEMKPESTYLEEEKWRLTGLLGSELVYKFNDKGRLLSIEHPSGVNVTLEYSTSYFNSVITKVQHSTGPYISFDSSSHLSRITSSLDTNVWVSYTNSTSNLPSGYNKQFIVRKHFVQDNGEIDRYYRYYYKTVSSKSVIGKKENPAGDAYYWDYNYSSDMGLRAIGNRIESGGRTNLFKNIFAYYGSYNELHVEQQDASQPSYYGYHIDTDRLLVTQVDSPYGGLYDMETREYSTKNELTKRSFSQGSDTFAIGTGYNTHGEPDLISSGYNTNTLSADMRLTWDDQRSLALARDALYRGFKIEYSTNSYAPAGPDRLPWKISQVSESTNRLVAGIMFTNRITGASRQLPDDTNNYPLLLPGELYAYFKSSQYIQPLAITNANGHVTQFGYTNGLYLTSIHPPEGIAAPIYLDRNPLGHIKRIRQNHSANTENVTVFETDYAGRPLMVSNVLGQVSTFTYNDRGQLTYMQDAGGRFVTNTWLFGKLASSTVGKTGAADSATISLDYDPQMKTLWIKDPLNRAVEEYDLDAAGQVVRVTNVDGDQMIITRGVLGMVKEVLRFDQTQVGLQYNTKGWVSKVCYLDDTWSNSNTVSYTYLANGLLSQVSTATNNSIGIGYDQWNQPVSIVTTTPGRSNTVSYSYDSIGNLTNKTLLNGSTQIGAIGYTYDGGGRLSSATSPNSVGTWNYTYNAYHGGLVCLSNAAIQLRTDYLYDSLGRVTNIVHRNASGTMIRLARYAYDSSGMITNKVVSGIGMTSQTSSYTYDAQGQLIYERMPMYFTNSYSYNLAGNRTSAVLKGVSCTYTTPAAHNRLASWTGGGSMTYNTAGCVTALNRTTNKVDISSLGWDCEYQLTNVVAGAATVRYTYDVAGRKASRTQGGVTERYLYDGIHVVADTDGGGNLLRTYTYGPGMDDILSMTIHGSSGTTNYYYLKDLSNTVLALANSSGSIVESYNYDAYGNVTIKNSGGSVISTSAYGNRFLFQGREYDYTTQLYHFRARWYDPETGRWLSNDPIGISGGLNLYAFCGNDPVNFVDPMGWAHFGKRPLDMTGGSCIYVLSEGGGWFGDFFNIGLYHEQLFYDDGSGEDIGFFEPNIPGKVHRIGDDVAYREKYGCDLDGYDMSSYRYDDTIMRQAVEIVKNRLENGNIPYSLLGWGWGVKKYNCQDWCSEVRETYFCILYNALKY